ncbi:MAG: 2-C-methyl-D-erythritol 4-phosphate cytidylyltransferase, partial [Deltaproteobacteria bacterium]|nr:2-C-methyl-D-erythritol 4-phosphate cytidylyltransferase [Deltaproteobacteria bacterium]
MASAIIVAAGKGLRMNHTVRKQYLMLAGRPILSRTLRVFDACNDVQRIYLVVPEADFDFCRTEILPQAGILTRVELVPGGKERQDSVYNGLCAIDGTKLGIVVIHDGVRPFIQQKQLTACIAGAGDTGACILGIPISDTLKQLDKAGYIRKTVNRA